MEQDKDFNSVVSFKGARDVRMVYKMVSDIIGLSCIRQGADTGDDVFNVHMAVVTALLGKSLCVYGECVLER